MDRLYVTESGPISVDVSATGLGSATLRIDVWVEGPYSSHDEIQLSGIAGIAHQFSLQDRVGGGSVLEVTAVLVDGRPPWNAHITVGDAEGAVWSHQLSLEVLNAPSSVKVILATQQAVGGAPPPRHTEKKRSTGSRGAKKRKGRTGGSVSGPEPPSEEAARDQIYAVWFGTNRAARVKDAQFRGFGPDRDEQIRYGRCEIFIPRTHRLGSLGSPWFRRMLMGDDRLTLRDVQLLAVDAFWSSVADHLANVGQHERHAVVFIHGYNVSFNDAAVRAAQLGCDLKIFGPMAFFSWASRAKTLRYTNDEAAIEESEHDIQQFLVSFAERVKPDAVHVIAHSMGNRALLRAVDRIVSSAAAEVSTRFGQLVLAAPDVTPGLFRRVAESYRRVAERTTIYVSSRDRALALSEIVHGGSRVGDSSDGVFVAEGIDTVVASEIDAGFLGHFTPGAREVLSDLHDLLHRGTPAEKRFGMRSVEAGPVRYYVIQE